MGFRLKNMLASLSVVIAFSMALQPVQAGKTIEDLRIGIYLNTTRGASSTGSEGMRMALLDYDFDVDFVPDFRPETLAGFDAVVLPIVILYPPGTDLNALRDDLRAFAEQGGGVVLAQESMGWRQGVYERPGRGFQDIGIFPEIGLGTSLPLDGAMAWAPISLTPLVVVDESHPVCKGLPETFDQQYDGNPVKIGPEGKVIINYANNAIVRARKIKFDNIPSVVVGNFGKGRVVLSGPAIGLDRQPREFEGPPIGEMLRFFLNSVAWAAGLDEWEHFDIIED